MGPSKCPSKWVTGVNKHYLYGVITPLVTAEGGSPIVGEAKTGGKFGFFRTEAVGWGLATSVCKHPC